MIHNSNIGFVCELNLENAANQNSGYHKVVIRKWLKKKTKKNTSSPKTTLINLMVTDENVPESHFIPKSKERTEANNGLNYLFTM